MNYIYDIYLNLNKTLYDFYDWNKNDNIIHIKKIPIFIINSDSLEHIISNDIKVNIDFIKRISNKTETWNNIRLNNCTLFCDYNDIVAIEFDDKGNSIKKSFLYIDEEAEILEDTEESEYYDLKFSLIKKTPNIFKTRKQIKIDNFVNNELKNIDQKKLNYICIECLDSLSKNNNTNIKNLKTLEHTSSKYKNLYNILKLTSKGSK